MNQKLFDIVIPIGPNDKDQINNQIYWTKANIIGYRNIYLISYDPTLNIENCITINENIFPFNKKTISDRFGIRADRSGWYLQQLLKLYAGIIIPGILSKYLVIDCDTYFLNPTTFIDNNICLYNYGYEYHKPYFKHIQYLLPAIKRLTKKSGVCHHMIFDTYYILELFLQVETYYNNAHNTAYEFYEIFLISVDKSQLSGASEYELYFHYMLTFNPSQIKIRKLKWDNIARFGKKLDKLDYVSYHWHLRNNNKLLEFIKKYSMKIKNKIKEIL